MMPGHKRGGNGRDLSPAPSAIVRAFVADGVALNPSVIPDRPDASVVMDRYRTSEVQAWLDYVVEIWMEAPHPGYERQTLNDADGARAEWWDEHHVHVSFVPWHNSGIRVWVYVPWADLYPEFADAVEVLEALQGG